MTGAEFLRNLAGQEGCGDEQRLLDIADELDALEAVRSAMAQAGAAEAETRLFLTRALITDEGRLIEAVLTLSEAVDGDLVVDFAS